MKTYSSGLIGAIAGGLVLWMGSPPWAGVFTVFAVTAFMSIGTLAESLYHVHKDLRSIRDFLDANNSITETLGSITETLGSIKGILDKWALERIGR